MARLLGVVVVATLLSGCLTGDAAIDRDVEPPRATAKDAYPVALQAAREWRQAAVLESVYGDSTLEPVGPKAHPAVARERVDGKLQSWWFTFHAAGSPPFFVVEVSADGNVTASWGENRDVGAGIAPPGFFVGERAGADWLDTARVNDTLAEDRTAKPYLRDGARRVVYLLASPEATWHVDVHRESGTLFATVDPATWEADARVIRR